MLECMTLPPPARGHAKTRGQSDLMAANPTADHHRSSSQWELSELPVLEEKFASEGCPFNDRRA
jgi:hypothetical protein